MTKCFVTPCENHNHQGVFHGRVCKPCALYAEILEISVQRAEYTGLSSEVVDFITKNLGTVLAEIKEN